MVSLYRPQKGTERGHANKQKKWVLDQAGTPRQPLVPNPSGTLRLVQGCRFLQKLGHLVVLRESCGDGKKQGPKRGSATLVDILLYNVQADL